MRTVLLTLCLLMLPPMAWSQESADIEAPACFPLINGVHPIAPRVVEGEVADHLFWFCSPRGGELKIYGWSWPKGQAVRSALQAAQQAIIAASAKVSTAQSLYRSSMAFDCPSIPHNEASTRGSMCRERYRLMVAMWPQWQREIAP